MEKKIDIHLHLSERPIPDGLGMKISSGAEMLPHLDELGIGFGIIMSSGETQAMFGSNASCRRIAEQYPDRYAWMCGLDETEPETVYERLKQYREEGAVGVGELAVNHRLDHPFLEAVFQAAIECLEKEHEEPLFLVVGFYGPHFPFTCEPSLYRHYKGLLGEEELTALDCEDEYLEYRQTFTMEKARNCKAAYYGQVETLDGYVGRLYDKFRQRSREQLFIYVSDHGEQLGKHGIFGKQTLYQESVRVPLLVAGTGVGPGTRHGQVSLLDVSKTILAEAGADGSWHRGTAISLDKEEEPRPPVVIQQMLDLGGENTALAEAVRSHTLAGESGALESAAARE